jgi:hypothetical protein
MPAQAGIQYSVAHPLSATTFTDYWIIRLRG